MKNYFLFFFTLVSYFQNFFSSINSCKKICKKILKKRKDRIHEYLILAVNKEIGLTGERENFKNFCKIFLLENDSEYRFLLYNLKKSIVLYNRALNSNYFNGHYYLNNGCSSSNDCYYSNNSYLNNGYSMNSSNYLNNNNYFNDHDYLNNCYSMNNGNNFNGHHGYFVNKGYSFPVYFHSKNGFSGFGYLNIKDKGEVENRLLLCRELLNKQVGRIVKIYKEGKKDFNWILSFLEITKTNPYYYNKDMIRLFQSKDIPVFYFEKKKK